MPAQLVVVRQQVVTQRRRALLGGGGEGTLDGPRQRRGVDVEILVDLTNDPLECEKGADEEDDVRRPCRRWRLEQWASQSSGLLKSSEIVRAVGWSKASSFQWQRAQGAESMEQRACRQARRGKEQSVWLPPRGQSACGFDPVRGGLQVQLVRDALGSTVHR